MTAAQTHTAAKGIVTRALRDGLEEEILVKLSEEIERRVENSTTTKAQGARIDALRRQLPENLVKQFDDIDDAARAIWVEAVDLGLAVGLQFSRQGAVR